MKKSLDRRAQRTRDTLNRALKALRTLHKRGKVFFHANQLDGGKMRNLDDAECWLTDSRDALTQFLTQKES